MKVLLHICCGVCAGPVIEKLLCRGYTVTGYFYDPNIHPADEYERRLASAQKTANELNIELIEGKYDRERWFEAVQGTEYEPEGGKRCEICYRLRLQKTYEYAKRHMYDAFTTTLTIGPMKKAETINRIGLEIGADRFIADDYKRNGGSERAALLSRELGLYRQDYCGCVYGHEEQLKRKNEKKKNEKKS
jgi:epoxyqueuosine reductase